MTVEWEARTLDRLASIYVAATPAVRDAIVRCVERINARLAVDPGASGESRGLGRRAWVVHPLVVGYDLPPGGTVLVNPIAPFKGRAPDG